MQQPRNLFLRKSAKHCLQLADLKTDHEPTTYRLPVTRIFRRGSPHNVSAGISRFIDLIFLDQIVQICCRWKCRPIRKLWRDIAIMNLWGYGSAYWETVFGLAQNILMQTDKAALFWDAIPIMHILVDPRMGKLTRYTENGIRAAGARCIWMQYQKSRPRLGPLWPLLQLYFQEPRMLTRDAVILLSLSDEKFFK